MRGVRLKVIEDLSAVCVTPSWLSRLHAVQHVAKDAPVPLFAHEDHVVAHRAGHVRAQSFCVRSERKNFWVCLFEDAYARQTSQHAIKGALMRVRLGGQFAHRSRPCGDQSGDAETGGDVKRLCDSVTER